jgi:Ca2+-binding RTX toxin-like protein
VFNADGSPAGDDFIVNSTATSDQVDQSVTALADGRFVVTWRSFDTGDGSNSCIRGRVFNADGSPAGNDFIVNSTAADDQLELSVTALADGRFVVTWRSDDTGDGSGACIRGRVFNADGSPAGNDFIVNSTAASDQVAPSVTALADGRFVVTWQSDDTGDGSSTCIRARLFDANGEPAGDDFIVNTTGTNGQFDPSVTALADGRFVVSWWSNDPGDGSGACIRAQIFDPTKFNGTAGEDTWQGGSLADTINGGASADTLSGLGGNDVISGDAGNDILNGGAGNDRLFGGQDNDTLIGGTGADALFGGAGIDSASYQFSNAGVSINLKAGTGSGGHAAGDTLNGIENVLGSAFNDTLNGDNGANELNGGGGNDVLSGGQGGDNLIGGTGIDSASYQFSNVAVNVNLKANTATGGHAEGDTFNSVENLIGSAFNDVLTGSGANNTLNGGAGNDTLSGGNGNDTLLGGAGNDTLVGGAGADVLNGGADFDTASYSQSNAAVTVNLNAGTGNGGHATGDTLSGIEKVIGSNFNDTLIGTSGDDSLNGGAGNDTLRGLGGDDFLVGGAGNDTVVIANNGGFDIFADYTAGSDTIDLTGISGLNSYADVQARMSQAGANVVIDFGAGHMLRINNTTIATLDANQGDFLV